MVTRFFRITLVILVAALPFAAFGQVANPSGGNDSVAFDVTASGHDQVTLRVSCQDDAEYEKTFANGNAVRFSLRDMPGDTVADGQCTYQLWTSSKLKDNVKKQLDAVRGDAAATKKVMKANNVTEGLYQSGSFLVLDGRIFPLGLTETGAGTAGARNVGGNSVDSGSIGSGSSSNAGSRVSPGFGRNLDPVVQDQVIPDDLIVQSSTCTGFDCVDGESFGFDTFRLKENNLRIHFDDTSSSAGFPANDWRLIANDSASGGANKFSIEDSTAARNPVTIEAGAPANALYVDSTGNIGFQQAAPGLDLHITTSDTPAMRYEQTNAGGFTAQTWDIGANEANFFIRDLTGGSRLSFRIRPGAPTSSIDISADGDVGVGTASPNANTRMDFSDTTQIKARIAFTGQEFFQASNTSTDGVAMLLGVNRTANRQLWIADTALLTQNTTNKVVRIHPNNGAIDAIFTNGSATNLILNQGGGFIGIGGITNPTQNIHHSSGATLTGGNWTNASSREYKQDICELDNATAFQALEKLNPVTYAYKSNPDDRQAGFIAEEVPEVVATPDHKGLSAMDVVAVLTAVVKEQQKTIDELTKKVSEIEKQ